MPTNLNTCRILDGTILALAAAPDDWDGYEQIAVVGAYKGHWQGEFEVTNAMLDQMAGFGNSKKIKTPTDYGHELIYNSSADASGWIAPGDFEVRGAGKKAALFAKITWTEKARAKIAAQEILYKSPTIIFNTPDRKTGRTGGASIHSVALTNTPFLHELPEVRLNSIMAAMGSMDNTAQRAEESKMKDELVKLLGLATDATDEMVLAAVKGSADLAAKMSTDYAALAAELPGDNKLAILAELKAKAATADATSSRVAALEAAEAVRETERKNAVALSAVKAAQAEGKILGDGTEHFKAHLALAQADPERFAVLAAAMPPVSPVGIEVIRKPDSSVSATGLSEEQRAINARFGVSDEMWIKANPAGAAAE